MSHKFMLSIKQSSPLDLQREGKKPVVGKRYFAGTLEEMIMDYHLKQMSLVEKRKGLDPLLMMYFCNTQMVGWYSIKLLQVKFHMHDHTEWELLICVTQVVDCVECQKYHEITLVTVVSRVLNLITLLFG
jgi:hypothetical protein